MIIGACGFCATGSSAVCDYLREFDENQVLDEMEFTIPYLPDGLEDLEYHLTQHACRDDASSIAIPRFRRFMRNYEGYLKAYGISKAEQKEIIDIFLERLIQFTWRSVRRSDRLLFPNLFYRYFAWSIIKNRVIPFINKRLGHCVHMFPYRDIDVSINPECFTEDARFFILTILKKMGADFSKNIVLDQPFIGENPSRSFHFFENPKAIVVDRDPRDNYLFMRTYMYKRSNMMPADTVQNFVKYFKLLRREKSYLSENDNVLNIKFESLIYEYENTTKLIRNFCFLPENEKAQTFFKPSLSIQNTQLFRRFPEYGDDIKYIEDNLTDYLYDFDKFPSPIFNNKMFDKAER